MPELARRADAVPARLYNRWRLARLRVGLPLRFDLPGLRGLRLLVGEKSWVCFDPQLADLPILAWTDFAAQGRSSLTEPVRCELRYYHFGASMVRAKVLALMEQMLDERIDRAR